MRSVRRASNTPDLFAHLVAALALSLFLLFSNVLLARHVRYHFFETMWSVRDANAEFYAARTKRAVDFLSSARAHGAPVALNASDLCVSIQHATRDPPTIYRTVASLLDSGSAREFALAVLDSGASPSADLDLVLGAHANITVRTRQEAAKSAGFAVPRYVMALTTWEERQRVDYALALTLAGCAAQPAANSCKYVLVLENDAVVSRSLVEQLVGAARALDARDPRWGLLRLFRSDFWAGWEDKDRAYFAGFGLCAALLARLLLLLAGAARGRQPGRAVVAVWMGFAALWGMLLPLFLGKQNLPLVGTRRSGGVVDATEYGSVSSIAHVYPLQVACDLASRLIDTCCDRGVVMVDLAIEPLLKGLGRGRFYELLPNLAQHIGFSSSSETKRELFANLQKPHHVQSSSFRDDELVY